MKEEADNLIDENCPIILAESVDEDRIKRILFKKNIIKKVNRLIIFKKKLIMWLFRE